MLLKSIRIKNFKSIDDVTVHLGRLNIFIGPNASGKSNIIEAVKFFRDVSIHGLDNAIAMQGGFENIKNQRTNFKSHVIIEAKFELDKVIKRGTSQFTLHNVLVSEDVAMEYEGRNFEYTFSLVATKNGEYTIVNDRFSTFYDFYEAHKKGDKYNRGKLLGTGIIDYVVKNKHLNISSDIEYKFGVEKERIIHDVFLKDGTGVKSDISVPSQTLFMQNPYFPFALRWPSRGLLLDVSTYDFDPKLSKKAAQATGKAELDENGNNLALILSKICKVDSEWRKLNYLIKRVLPFVNNMDIRKTEDRSVLFRVEEDYLGGHYFPSGTLSDGTISVIAIIVALYFQPGKIKIFEEPERNMHPVIISKIMRMMIDASTDSQIIITTHNPELLKHADNDSIYFVARNNKGNTSIYKPARSKKIKHFLTHDIGMAEMFVNDLLGSK